MKTNLKPSMDASVPKAGKGKPKPATKSRLQAEKPRFFEGILQASSDGILAVNRENKVLYANERFVEMWNIPQEVMASKDDTLLLQYVLDQLADPQGFLNKVVELYASAEESFDTLYFKDGRVFERLSRPMLKGAKVRGRVWSFRDFTGRKKVEDALAASEAELRALFASMQDIVLVIDREGVYRKIAPTNPGLLVKPPNELLGMNLTDVFPAENAATFLRVVQQVLDTKQNSQIEYELMIGGKTVWFQTTISPLNEESTLWVAHDITRRKQIEKALQVAEKNYRSIFENATVGVYQSTPQGRFRSVNPVMARIFGYDSPEEMLSSISSIEKQYYVNTGDRQEFQRLLSEQGEVREFISQNRRKDGGLIWVQENARAVREADGSVLHYEGFITDITERKQAEEAFRNSEQQFRQIFELAPDGYYLADLKGNFLDGNRASEQMSGFSKEELIGKNFLKIGLLPLNQIPKAAVMLGKAILGQSVGPEQLTLIRKDKSLLEIEIRVHSTKINNQVVVLGIARDITERKRAEEELRRAKDELETVNLDLLLSLEREKKLACTDGLTGLYNHRHFFELAAREFHAAFRHRRPLAFLMFDMDDFKGVNDTLGHAVGDRLLARVAQTAVDQVRASDVIARYGGDEFIALLPYAGAQQALPVAERIRASVAALLLEDLGELPEITLSIGIAELSHEPPDENVERVIQRADEALYTAKSQGRNRTVIHGLEPQSPPPGEGGSK